jgi:hypothetical protein
VFWPPCEGNLLALEGSPVLDSLRHSHAQPPSDKMLALPRLPSFRAFVLNCPSVWTPPQGRKTLVHLLLQVSPNSDSIST